MKNIPLFTAQNGIASLILKEVPVSGRAYVLIKTVWNGQIEGLLQECGSFCRAAGAIEVYASWQTEPLPARHAYDVISMELEKAYLPPAPPLELEGLAPENGADYLEIYNSCFRDVVGAASYDEQDLQRLYETDCAFLVRVAGAYAAVAEISQQGLEGIAVLPPYRGLGYPLALTVLPMVPRKTICLKVADNNQRALALYHRLGFVQTGVVSRWWRLC